MANEPLDQQPQMQIEYHSDRQDVTDNQQQQTQSQDVAVGAAEGEQGTVAVVSAGKADDATADTLNQINTKLDGLSGSIEQQRQQIGGIADNASDLTVSKLEQSRDAIETAEVVQLDSAQYEYLVESFKLSNSLCLVSFLMLCMAVGIMLAGRFLGGVARG